MLLGGPKWCQHSHSLSAFVCELQAAMLQLNLRQWMLLHILQHQILFMLAIANQRYSQSLEAAKKIVGGLCFYTQPAIKSEPL